jgi:hypothetical protein
LDGVDVRLGLAVGGDIEGELHGEIPLQRLVGVHETEEVTEQPWEEAAEIARGS